MEEENIIEQQQATVDYNDDNIRTLSGTEHIRLRPGMYIGRLGDGSLPEDGIYVLLKEVIDNSIDEFKMKAGNRIEIIRLCEMLGHLVQADPGKLVNVTGTPEPTPAPTWYPNSKM